MRICSEREEERGGRGWGLEKRSSEVGDGGGDST
jgi:hypothetical protein